MHTMHTIYRIHNNSNVFYTLLGVVFRWYKQRRCTHDWRNKEFGIMEHDYASTTEKRCVKCKKTEFKVMLK